MISRVVLKGWKAFDRLELDLAPGATFVLSSNGVGKSSFIEGAMWTLLGSYYLAPEPEEYVRGGHDEAVCEIDLTVGGNTTTVRRALSRDRSKGAVHVDGTLEANAERSIGTLFQSRLNVDLATFATLGAMREGDVYRESGEGAVSLSSTLAEVLGLGRATDASTAADRIRRRWEREGDQIRKRSRLPSEHRETLDRRLWSLPEEVATQEQVVANSEEVLRSLRERLDQWDRWNEYQQRMREHQMRRSSALARARGFGVSVEEGEDALERVTEELQSLNEMCSSKAQEIGALQNELRRLVEGRSLLSEAGTVCPTCMRPMTEEVAELAQEHREEEVNRLEVRLEEARSDLSAAYERAQELQGILQIVQAVGPEEPDSPQNDEGRENIEQLVREQEEALRLATEELGAKREEMKQLERSAAEDDAAAAEEAHAILAYKRSAAAEVLGAALEASVTRLSREMIEPISAAVSDTWKRLWGRGTTLGFDRDGRLQLDGVTTVPYSGFSGGEKSFSSVLVRLVTLSSLCVSPFIWLDEPLEHLDPANRRSLAALLATVAAEGPFTQVLVTTYEEHVARRLAESVGDGAGVATLQYIRGADTSNANNVSGRSAN